MYKYLLFFLLSLLYISPNNAQNLQNNCTPFTFTFEGKADEDSINVHTFAGVGRDSTRQLTLNKILTQKNALNWQKNPPFIDRHDYYWRCFRLVNATDDTLKKGIWSSYFDHSNLYVLRNNALVATTISGRFAPLSIKLDFNAYRTFHLELPPKSETDYYINYYFEVKRTFHDSIFLFSPSRLARVHERRFAEEAFNIKRDNFLFNSLFILMFMTLIFYYVFPRNLAFLYYMGYLFFILCYYANSGNLYYGFYPKLDGIRPYFYVLEMLTSYGCYAFYNLFVIQFSDTGKSYPRLIKIARYFNVALLTLVPIHCLTTYYAGTAANHFLFVSVKIITLTVSCWMLLSIVKHGKSKLNAFIYIGTTCLLLFVLRGTIETITELFNFYPNNWLNNLDDNYPLVGIKLGVILENIFFSIGLIFKGKQLQKEQQLKELNLQKQYIEQLETTQQWQKKYQTELEQEIAIKAGQLAYFENEQAIERTRSQIAQDIHDEVGGSFTKISLSAEIAARQPNLSETDTKTRFEKLGADARQGAASLREIIFAINPDYDNFSEMQAYFMEFAHNFWENTSVNLVFDFEKSVYNPIVRPDIKRQLLLIFKEAQNNAAKYAHATTIHLTLKIVENDHYLMDIKDNGKGFDPLSITAQNGHPKGISGMKKRAESIGSQLVIHSKLEKGTTIRVEGKL